MIRPVFQHGTPDPPLLLDLFYKNMEPHSTWLPWSPNLQLKIKMLPVADLHSKILDTPPLGVQILSISCSFWENLAKSYVGAPPESWRPLLGEILDPPLVTLFDQNFCHYLAKSVKGVKVMVETEGHFYHSPVFLSHSILKAPPPPMDQTFLNFMEFWGKSSKFVHWRSPMGLAPLPRGILYPPLFDNHFFFNWYKFILLVNTVTFLFSTASDLSRSKQVSDQRWISGNNM